jgi:PPK2 family polyphosphate:nucleotide phosphotransferase
MTTQVLAPGSPVNLEDFDPSYRGEWKKDEARQTLKDLQKRMDRLQERLYAEGKQSLLVVLQAMDAGGKDSTIRRVFEGVNPQGVRVTGFKAPTQEERDHDFLWRIHQHAPRKGYIAVFNRSHYEDVLVVRVNNLVDESVWRSRYDHINNFERLLYDSGTRILKFYLHISKEEQRERFQERLDDPEKHWKFSRGDLPVRDKWPQYMEAFEAVLTRCNTEYAPWHIVPANRKWYRDLVVAQTIVETLEDMDPQFPAAEPGLNKIVIPD